MNYQQLTDEIEKLDQFIAQLKQNNMIFQYSSKIEYAEFLGIPAKDLFYLPYNKWSQIQILVIHFKDRAMALWEANKMHPIFNEINQKDNQDIKIGEIWEAYKNGNRAEFENLLNEIRNIINNDFLA